MPMRNPHPQINTYQDALKIYEETKPSRGDPEKRRPFFLPRRKYLDIFKYENGDISVRSNGHDLVVFKPTNLFVIPKYTWYASRAYAKLISLILRGREFFFTNRHNRFWLSLSPSKIIPIGEHDVTISRDYRAQKPDILGKHSWSITFEHTPFLRAHAGDYVEITKLDVKKLTAIRNAHFRTFSKYIKGATKLREKTSTGESVITLEEAVDAGADRLGHVGTKYAFNPPTEYTLSDPRYMESFEKALKVQVDKYNALFDAIRYEDYHKAYLVFARSSASYHWSSKSYFKLSGVLNEFKKFLMISYSEHIFYKEKVTTTNRPIPDLYKNYLELYGVERIDRKPLT